jgi:hypothetical protein
MSGEEFLRRWSRRKPAAAHPPAPSDEPASTPAPPAPAEDPPPVDAVALEDIAGWLRRNVPAAWRQAALRRIWVADPAIRDFIGPADYAWDWNTPGDAPGYGPLRALDDAAKLLAQVLGDPPAPSGSTDAGDPPMSVRAHAIEMEEVAPPAPNAEPASPTDLDPVPATRRRRRGGSAAPV